MHGHGRVAQHRLRSRRGDADKLGLARLRVDHRIAQVPEVARIGFVKHFVVADGRLQIRVPVDQPLAAIDQPLLEQTERTYAAPRGHTVGSSVNRVRCQSQLQPSCSSWPRIRASYSFFHFQMRSTSAARPRSCRAELFFFQQPPLDHGLRGDAGMIGARHPQRVVALHPPPADENILQRVVQRMPQVQRAGHVRRRNDDRIRLALRVGLAVKIAAILPERIPAVLRRLVIVLLGKLLGGHFSGHDDPCSR